MEPYREPVVDMLIKITRDAVIFQVKDKSIDQFNDLLNDTIKNQDIITRMENIALEAKNYPFLTLKKSKVREIIVKSDLKGLTNVLSINIENETEAEIRMYSSIRAAKLDDQGYLLLFFEPYI